MASGPLFQKLEDRIKLDKEDGDIAYFNALTLQLEYITKLVTAGVTACIADDADRNRYSLEYGLVRADSIGEWVETLNSALTGPAANFIRAEATPITRELTERVKQRDWRKEAVDTLAAAAVTLGIDPQLGNKNPQLRQSFGLVAAIRNRTRGHGATTSSKANQVAPLIETAAELLKANLQLFYIPWAYLHRNFSGKYRVSPLLGDRSDFDYLTRTKNENLPGGVHIYLDGPVQVPLVFSDPEIQDIYVANGNFSNQSFETLSVVTDDLRREDGSKWATSPGRLPSSETEGQPSLDQVGHTFANLPRMPSGFIHRPRLQESLRTELLNTERHPIVSLTGPGGIGKTTLAIAVVESIAKLEGAPYDIILWLSSRDIDLLETGPKSVTPGVVKKEDIARSAVDLLEPAERDRRNFDAVHFFQKCLTEGAAGTTLFVLDNFETLDTPGDTFSWIDTFIRQPNKILITTRFRDFRGDYPIEIGGMEDDEATSLIQQESQRLGVQALVTGDYRQKLVAESDGHPYVIKILLGQIAKERRTVEPKRIVADADHILAALFERTFENLSPGAQRVFLLLCSWRVFVPEVAVEAVALRPDNDRFDVRGALEELQRFSLTEEVLSETDGEPFIGVPLAASSFGRHKLQTSQFKLAVEEDRKLLLEFGAGKKEDAQHGVLPRIERLVKRTASRASENPDELDRFIPVLEYLAFRVPRAYLHLAELVLEVRGYELGASEAQKYIKAFVENAPAKDKLDGWMRLADLSREVDNTFGEVHALAQAALLPTASTDTMGSVANRINGRIRELRGRQVEEAWSPEVRQLVHRVAQAMDSKIDKLTATECSRLAWLYLNVGSEDRALDVARVGVGREPDNEYCQNLVTKLEN